MAERISQAIYGKAFAALEAVNGLILWNADTHEIEYLENGIKLPNRFTLFPISRYSPDAIGWIEEKLRDSATMVGAGAHDFPYVAFCPLNEMYCFSLDLKTGGVYRTREFTNFEIMKITGERIGTIKRHNGFNSVREMLRWFESYCLLFLQHELHQELTM